jgi:serine/threonine-protein kinase SRPK3
MACTRHGVRYILRQQGDSDESLIYHANSLRQYVTLKMYISNTALGNHLDDELQAYQRIAKGPKRHPGRQAIRSLLAPLSDNLSTFLRRNPVRQLPKPILAFVLHRLFLALDYLHRECQIIHTGITSLSLSFLICVSYTDISNVTDIKPDNIMFSVPNNLVFQELEQNELLNPL